MHDSSCLLLTCRQVKDGVDISKYTVGFRNISCVANMGEYEFAHSNSNGDFLIVLRRSKLVNSETNCEAPLPRYTKGNHFYLP